MDEKRFSFNKTRIEALPSPAGKRVYYYDTRQPGLTICVTPAGTKTFYLCRKIDGKPERYRIGPFRQVTVENARDIAAARVGEIAKGENPAEERRTRRASPTFKAMFEEFIELPTRTKAKRQKSPKTVHDYRLQFNRYLADWHNRKLAHVSRADVERLHNHISKTSGCYQANRVLALVKALFNTAVELGYVAANPAARLREFDEQSRERFLQPDEFPRFWAELEAEPSELFRDFFKVALFTGQRRSNVASMRWEDVNLERGIWTIPKTKTGKHAVPLTEQVLQILARRKAAVTGDYVFPGRYGSHLKDPMNSWRRILKRAQIEDLRIHDLRRSLGSWQAMTGASLPIIGKTLGHSRPETTAVYSRLNDVTVLAAMTTATDAMLAAASPSPSTEDESEE